MRMIKALWGGFKLFNRTNCFNRAAAISFFAFFSLIPLMLFITALLGFMLGKKAGLLEQVIEMTRASLPYLGTRIVNDLRGLSKEWMTFGWLSVISLLLSAELVLKAGSDALEAIFEIPAKYSFFRRKLINIGILLIAASAAFVSIIVTAAAKLVTTRLGLSIFGVDIAHILIQSFAVKYLLPFGIVVMSVALVYRITAGSNLNLRYAFYGSLFFSVLWETAKHLFAWYVSNFPSYNKFYGSLGTFMVLLLWIFYSMAIFLFSASVARYSYTARRAGAPGRRKKKGKG